jgi:hypothetical protein
LRESGPHVEIWLGRRPTRGESRCSQEPGEAHEQEHPYAARGGRPCCARARQAFEPQTRGRHASRSARPLASAHAKSGNAGIEIAAYIGRSDQFAEALTAYAFACADQVERDYDAFLNAVRTGKIQARDDDGMAARLR